MILTRNDVLKQLEAHLAGETTSAQLAAWAFTTFYRLEMGALALPEDAAAISTVLDDLIFADDPSFALDEADVHRLIAQLWEL